MKKKMITSKFHLLVIILVSLGSSGLHIFQVGPQAFFWPLDQTDIMQFQIDYFTLPLPATNAAIPVFIDQCVLLVLQKIRWYQAIVLLHTDYLKQKNKQIIMLFMIKYIYHSTVY